MKQFNISVTKTLASDGHYSVLFFVKKVKGIEHTFCELRKSEGSVPYAGVSIRNPKDVLGVQGFDPNRGMHDSFKRAVYAMLASETGYILPEDASRFRGAFWIALGKPGYKKLADKKLAELVAPESKTVMLDFSGKTQYAVEVPVT